MGWIIVNHPILVGAKATHAALIKSPRRAAGRISRVGRAAGWVAHTKVVPALGSRGGDGLGQCPVDQAGTANDRTGSRATGRGWRAEGSDGGRKTGPPGSGIKTDL